MGMLVNHNWNTSCTVDQKKKKQHRKQETTKNKNSKEKKLKGHYLYSKEGELKRWYTRDWMDYDAVKENETSIVEIEF